MKASFLVNTDENIVKPFTSVAAVEEILLEKDYVVVMDGAQFLGLLTPRDVMKNPHLLVVDCLSTQRRLRHDQEIHEIHSLMTLDNLSVLPVFGANDEYLGSITAAKVFESLQSMASPPVEVKFSNIIGDPETESIKQVFSHELYHSTKNPLQVIYSALGLLETISGKLEREILIQKIYMSAKKIDDVIERLNQEYLA
jgi:predicted transcriptional regulator